MYTSCLDYTDKDFYEDAFVKSFRYQECKHEVRRTQFDCSGLLVIFVFLYNQ